MSNEAAERARILEESRVSAGLGPEGRLPFTHGEGEVAIVKADDLPLPAHGLDIAPMPTHPIVTS